MQNRTLTPTRAATIAALLLAVACGGDRADRATTDTSITTTSGGTVAPAPSRGAGDRDDLDDRIEDAIEANAEFRGADVDVEEEDGRIVLEGTVRSTAQQALVQSLARRMADTVPVISRLRVQ